MPFSNMDSLRLNALLGSFNKQSRVYPTMVVAPTITCGTGLYVLGAFVEIVPVNTITSQFKIDYMSFANFSSASTYEVVIYKGLSGSEVEIGRIRVHPGATTNSVLGFPVFSKALNANERISVKCAGASASTAVTSIVYHLID